MPDTRTRIVIEINPERTGYGIDAEIDGRCVSISHLKAYSMDSTVLGMHISADITDMLRRKKQNL